MTKINVAVCDDQREGMELITAAVENEFMSYGIRIEVKQYTDPVEFLSNVDNGVSFDVVFLDIDMPELDGITLARKLKAHSGIIVIFVSNREEYIFDALKINPFTFVRKREIKTDMSYAVENMVALIKKRYKERNKTITLESNNKVYRFNPYKIMYVEIHDKIITFHEKDSKFDIPYRLSDLLQVLEEYRFIQIHRKIAVNCLYIFAVERKDVVLDNGHRLPLSKYKEKEVREKFCEMAGK